MIRVSVYSLAAMLGLFSSQLLAVGNAYQVELLAFAQAMPNTEVFDQTVGQINWPPGLTELEAYRKPDTTALDGSYAALSKDAAYRPILHIAWIQPEGINAPVHIQSADGRLNGYVQLHQGQGLQMTVDFELSANPEEPIYRLNEKRSFKLSEVYYLDHPKFGMVVKISPVSPE